MGIGFNSDSFLNSHIKPFLQDVGLRKTLTFSKKVRTVGADGKQSEAETTSSTTGIVESDPKMDGNTLKMVFPDGDMSKEVVKIFFVESDLDFAVTNGQTVSIYKSTTLLGKYRIKYAPRNMVVTDICVAYCVSSE